jgi:asparaginyl-tRNA synthetase
MRHKIKTLKSSNLEKNPLLETTLTVKGWVRTIRKQKKFSFVEVNDGSTLSNLQVILDASLPNYEQLSEELTTGCSVSITGLLKESPAKGQAVELQAKEVTIIGSCPADDYPLQKKRHSFEFLRSIAHLRPRTNTLGAITRVRNALAFATHKFFQEKDFLYINTPIITAADCEGAGELFRVTTLKGEKFAKDTLGEEDFFKKPTYLTVSGQLNAETYACGLSDVYTFGPTFRAENSNTSRHLAEFWMIEPEMAFADLKDDMDCAESYLKYLISHLLENLQEDMKLFDSFIEKGIIEKLSAITKTDFERISYTKAVDILQNSDHKFEFPVKWGLDLQSEHERFLTEQHFKKPVIVYDYPKEIKAFYMRLNDDGKTVAAMDVLVPGVGEIIGGSQREERYDTLLSKMEEHNLDTKEYEWYLDLRKYGSVPHAGFGLGFERMVQFCTGMENIRDVIPFPRSPGHASF